MRKKIRKYKTEQNVRLQRNAVGDNLQKSFSLLEFTAQETFSFIFKIKDIIELFLMFFLTLLGILKERKGRQLNSKTRKFNDEKIKF